MGMGTRNNLSHTQAMDRGTVESKEVDGELAFDSIEVSLQVEFLEAKVGWPKVDQP